MRIWSLTGLIPRRLAVAGVCATALVACGGGGGGGGPSSVSYTGSTAQAAIDSTNAADLAGGAFVSGDAGASANVVGVAVSGSASRPVQQRSVEVANMLRNAVSRIDLQSSPRTVVGTTQTDSNTVAGPCGGSFNYTISVDDVTGTFNGSLSFNAYCEVPGNSISGHVSFSGQIDLNTLLFTSLQFNATYLALADNGQNFAISGTIAFVFSGNVATVTETFNIQDGSGTVYRVDNLAIVLTTDTSGNVQETLIGRFYHPIYGYIDVVTNTAFVVPAGSAFPTSGSLTISGAGNTSAVLTALSDGTYTLDIDTDGNGTLETHVTGNWVDL